MVFFRFLTILFCIVIIGLSCIPGDISSKFSKRAISNTGKRLFNLTDTKWIHYYIRRSCHLVEFFILEILLTFSFSEQLSIHPYAVLIALAVAVFDEVVKLFIKGRHFSFEDIILDGMGIVIAVIVLHCVGKCFV